MNKYQETFIDGNYSVIVSIIDSNTFSFKILDLVSEDSIYIGSGSFNYNNVRFDYLLFDYCFIPISVFSKILYKVINYLCNGTHK